MKDGSKMATISSQIKFMCNGSRNFIPIIFHLVRLYPYGFIHMIDGFIDILNGEITSDDSTESRVETSDPSCTEAIDHSSEQASSSEIEVDGLVSTETDDLNNTQTDGHNSKGIVDCENVENDKVERDNNENNHKMTTRKSYHQTLPCKEQ